MAWQKILACGLVASAVFVGCTVTTDDPGEDDSGNGSGSGGKSSGGSSSGGASSGGAKASGGSTASGGTDSGADFVCDPAAQTDICLKCLQSKCCDEYLACGEDEFCAYRTEADPGEAICIQSCLVDQLQDAGVTDIATCAGSCQGSRARVSDATNDLINCMTDTGDSGVLGNCSTPCFGGEI